MPMPLRLTVAHPSVDAVRGAVAMERGPVVYCFESPDQPDGVDLNHAEIRVDQPISEEAAPTCWAGTVPVARVAAIARDDTAWSGSGWATLGEQPRRPPRGRADRHSLLPVGQPRPVGDAHLRPHLARLTCQALPFRVMQPQALSIPTSPDRSPSRPTGSPACSTVTVGGRDVPASGRGRFALPTRSGQTTEARVRAQMLDPYATVEVGGQKYRTGPVVPIWLRILGLLPILLIAKGGLIGGLIAALGIVANFWIIREVQSTALKVLALFGVLPVAVIVWLVVAPRWSWLSRSGGLGPFDDALAQLVRAQASPASSTRRPAPTRGTPRRSR
jgi:hypothetical protein